MHKLPIHTCTSYASIQKARASQSPSQGRTPQQHSLIFGLGPINSYRAELWCIHVLRRALHNLLL